jgi:polyisoprenoid-binding protein YceI
MIARLLLIASCAVAVVPSAASADAVFPGKSEIAFTLKQMGVNFDGRFKAWKADIVFQPAALDKAKALIDVDLASLDLASADSEEEARGPLWFNTV